MIWEIWWHSILILDQNIFVWRWTYFCLLEGLRLIISGAKGQEKRDRVTPRYLSQDYCDDGEKHGADTRNYREHRGRMVVRRSMRVGVLLLWFQTWFILCHFFLLAPKESLNFHEAQFLISKERMVISTSVGCFEDF